MSEHLRGEQQQVLERHYEVQVQSKMGRVTQTDFVDLHAQLYLQRDSLSLPFWVST
jgi:hypothetical protein